MSDVVPRMKGGAVMEWRSPLKDAIDCGGVSLQYQSIALHRTLNTLINEDQEPLFCGATPPPSLLSRDMIEGVMVEWRSKRISSNAENQTRDSEDRLRG